jgi:selT/selW/selH-like putative selenoprotein
VSLAAELMGKWAPIMRTVELRSASKGWFEVTLDGELVFSKITTGRLPRQGEIAGQFEKKLGPPLIWRQTGA